MELVDLIPGSKDYYILNNLQKLRKSLENLKTGISTKQSTPKFPKNKHFLPPAYQEVRNVCFLEILVCFALLKPRFEIRPFVLLPMISETHSDYQQNQL